MGKRARVGVVPGAGGRDTAPLSVAEFLEVYQEVIGADEVNEEEMLKTLGESVVIDEMERTIHFLDVSSLPMNPHEKLKRLFELQTHWKPEVIGALVGPALKGQKVEPWLMKWTRAVFVVIP